MSRISIVLTLIIFQSSLCFSQAKGNRFVYVAGSTTDSTIKVIHEQVDTIIKRFMTFEGNGLKDTIYFSKSNNFHANTCRIFQIQIDGKGLKEVHIVWTYESLPGLGDYIGNETSWGSDLKFLNHEIWNLDSKEVIFTALSYYFLEEYSEFRGTKHIAKEYYKYDFVIDDLGQITISDLDQLSNKIPDRAEGIYKFINGIYTLQ